MGNVEKKHGVYFIMHDEEPNGDSFLRMAHEVLLLGFDDDRFQRVMILTPLQMRHFLGWISRSLVPAPRHEDFGSWVFAGFMLRTLYGKIE